MTGLPFIFPGVSKNFAVENISGEKAKLVLNKDINKYISNTLYRPTLCISMLLRGDLSDSEASDKT